MIFKKASYDPFNKVDIYAFLEIGLETIKNNFKSLEPIFYSQYNIDNNTHV